MADWNEAQACREIAASGLFDGDWYLREYPDVAAAGMDPLLHYVRHGEKEGRLPNSGGSVPHYRGTEGDSRLQQESIRMRREATPPVPVVFACNEKYAPYLSVAIASLIFNSSPSASYDIRILYSALPEKVIATIEKQATANCKITFVPVAHLVQEIRTKGYISSHITHESYYRVLVAKLMATCERVIYLDCDIVINSDIALLARVELFGNIIGAVENPPVSPDYMKGIFANFPHRPEKYFNAGVLLINNAEFIAQDINSRFLDLVFSDRKFRCHDQDILNIICEGKIYELDPTWNWQWQYFYKEQYIHSGREMFAAHARSFARPALVHFNSDIKPWQQNDGHFAPMFWFYARFSPWFDQLKIACPYPLDDILARCEAGEIL